ncbi:MAG: GNAT family N-acetyltransferase [Rhizobiales bacterium]|nr:GNAT family N-acetyltransferase [Hyphomicrobiales bacterium]MBA70565.1 GNAT family N-acetyltransferase [Hyphomicrobiales bacterium]|tara:strand:- start:301 stop:756 length:456 start_codon:yes stop_codon:yes gene_type:complete
MSDVVIRPLTADDKAEWRRLWTGYLEFYESEVSEEVYETTFSRLLAGNAGTDNEYRGLLAVIDGQPVGLVHYLFHRHCWKVEDVCYLQDLYADPEVRGQGIGRSLIEAVYKAADEAGNPGVYWTTQEFNAVGRRLYDRIGKLTPFIKYSRF